MALVQTLLVIVAAPLLVGWVDQCRAWLQNRRGAGVLQPYRTLRKLLHKDAVIAHGASPIFRASPYVQFGAMALAAAIIPVLSSRPLLATSADTIALVGVFAVARVFAALAGMAVESLTTTVVPPRALALRALLLERERIANHLGDLGALGNDAGLGFGLAQFLRLKEDLLRINEQVWVARYPMDAIVPGGVQTDLPPDAPQRLVDSMASLQREVMCILYRMLVGSTD